MVSVAPDVDVEGGKVGEFWSLNVLILKCVSCRQPSATSTLHPWVETGLPSAVLKTDSTDWNILNYWRYICIVSEIYFHSLPSPRDIYSQSAVSKYLHLRAEDPLKVYSNANTWENFIAKVNKASRWDGFIGEINLSVLYGVWAELLPPYEVYQPQGPQGGKRTR